VGMRWGQRPGVQSPLAAYLTALGEEASPALPDGSDRLLASLTPDGSPTAAEIIAFIVLEQ
jgi:hypothetical protein